MRTIRAGFRRNANRRRRGASLIECVITLALFLMLVFGALDLGLAVFRYHLVSYTARAIAREAIVHGSLADRLGPWGPTTITGTADGPSEPDPNDPLTQIQTIAEPLLIGMSPEEVDLEVEWPDGGNNAMDENRVRVIVRAEYSPIFGFILGNQSFDLVATSSMQIAH